MTSKKRDKIDSLDEFMRIFGDPKTYHHHKTVRMMSDAQGTLNSDNWWKFREAMRYVVADYVMPLAYNDFFQEKLASSHILFETWPHISVQDPGMVAYTANSSDGHQDRQVRSKFGKYLQRFNDRFGFSSTEIAALANEFNTTGKPPELKFAVSAEEIRYVYEHGPKSCMTVSFKHLKRHPSEAYAVEPIAVAYVESKGKITGRVLIRQDTKVFCRPYGNEFALSMLLAERGYKIDENGLVGCKLAWIPYEGFRPELKPEAFEGLIAPLILPYVDLPANLGLIDFNDKTIQICKTGLSTEEKIRARGSRKKAVFVSLTETSGFKIVTAPTESLTHDEYARMSRITGGYAIAKEWYRDNVVIDVDQTVCELCERTYPSDGAEFYYLNPNGEPICYGCLQDSQLIVPVTLDGGASGYAWAESAWYCAVLDTWLLDGVEPSEIDVEIVFVDCYSSHPHEGYEYLTSTQYNKHTNRFVRAGEVFGHFTEELFRNLNETELSTELSASSKWGQIGNVEGLNDDDNWPSAKSAQIVHATSFIDGGINAIRWIKKDGVYSIITTSVTTPTEDHCSEYPVRDSEIRAEIAARLAPGAFRDEFEKSISSWQVIWETLAEFEKDYGPTYENANQRIDALEDITKYSFRDFFNTDPNRGKLEQQVANYKTRILFLSTAIYLEASRGSSQIQRLWEAYRVSGMAASPWREISAPVEQPVHS